MVARLILTRNRSPRRVGFPRAGPNNFSRFAGRLKYVSSSVTVGGKSLLEWRLRANRWSIQAVGRGSQGNKGAITNAPRANTEEGMSMVQTGAAALFSLAAFLVAG